MDPSRIADIDYYTGIDSSTPAASQSTRLNSSEQVSHLGFALVLVIIISFCLERWGLKRWKDRASDRHQQQIQSLERIWRMTSDQKPP